MLLPLSLAQPGGHGGNNRGRPEASDHTTKPQLYGRFFRMFDLAPAPNLNPNVFAAIAGAMMKSDAGAPITETEPVDENPTIPAGYTYFGQFIDHDITLDTTGLNARTYDEPAETDFRSPAFDLDSVYGRGPGDQPYLYKNGLELRLGARLHTTGAAVETSRDLLRLHFGDDIDQRDDFAILGDKRNDENRIVTQIQSTFIAFHNRVVHDPDVIGSDLTSNDQRFAAAVQAVRWHYQWVVVNDYLKRILDPEIWSRYFGQMLVRAPTYYDGVGATNAYMPLEFSIAAFRLGHSQVRPSYAINSKFHSHLMPNGDKIRIPVFAPGNPDLTATLNGFPATLDPSFGIDWGYFLPEITANAPTTFMVPQPSYRIDATLVDPLANLPEFAGAGIEANLAYRNLVRGQMNGLPSAEAVAGVLGLTGQLVPPDAIWSAGSLALVNGALPFPGQPANTGGNKAFADQKKLRVDVGTQHADVLSGNTPLWYYILREAEWFGTGGTAFAIKNAAANRQPTGFPAAGDPLGGHYLGPLGSTIVAETFAGLLLRDPTSYVKKTGGAFVPHGKIAGDTPVDFNLSKLFIYALTGTTP